MAGSDGLGPRTAPRLGGRAWLAASCAVLLGIAPSEPAAARPPAELHRPRDPDDLPRMPAPGGQPQPDTLRRDLDFATDDTPRRRLQLTATPIYAAIKLPFVGRRGRTLSGGGAGLELDVNLYRPLSLRFVGAYTAHPVDDEFSVPQKDNEDPMLTAAGGAIHTGNGGLSLAYAMDFGRVLPLVDAGVGALWILTPEGVRDGQRGQPCTSAGACDTGLACAPDNTCQPIPVLELHAGLAIDVLVARHFTVGAGLRYFALLGTPSVFPIYLHATLRLGLRF